MNRWMLVVAVASAVACSSSKQAEPGAKAEPAATGQSAAAPSGKDSSMQTYTIAGTGTDAPVKIKVAIPSSWTADTSDPGGPTFKISGLDVRRLTFAALTSLKGDATERMAKAIKLQFDDGAGAERVDLPGGRVWMSEMEERDVHARMFVPYDGGVVMGIAIVPKASANRLSEIRAVLETLTVVP